MIIEKINIYNDLNLAAVWLSNGRDKRGLLWKLAHISISESEKFSVGDRVSFTESETFGNDKLRKVLRCR